MASSNGAIGWDDEVSSADAGENAQQDEFVILPDGTYPFKLQKIERRSFKGSQKLPPCNMVKVELVVDGGKAGRAYVYNRFYMHTSTLWQIYQFLEAVGLRKKGDTTAGRIPWEKVVKGMTGRCKVTHREWQDKTYNEVQKWLPDEPKETGDNQEPDEAQELEDMSY